MQNRLIEILIVRDELTKEEIVENIHDMYDDEYEITDILDELELEHDFIFDVLEILGQ